MYTHRNPYNTENTRKCFWHEHSEGEHSAPAIEGILLSENGDTLLAENGATLVSEQYV